MREKLLDLAVNFKDAPKDVQDAAKKHHKIQDEYQHAERQFLIWNQQRQALKEQFEASKLDFEKILKDWKVN